MQIKRVYKDISLRAGQEEIIDTKQMEKIYNCTDLFISRRLVSSSGPHINARYGKGLTFKEVLEELLAGKVVDQFFSSFQMV